MARGVRAKHTMFDKHGIRVFPRGGRVQRGRWVGPNGKGLIYELRQQHTITWLHQCDRREREKKNPFYVATTRRGGDHYPCPSNNSWRPSICIIIIIFLPLPPPFVRPKVGCVLLWGWWCSSRGIRSQDGVQQQQQHSISLGWNRFARFRLSIAGRGF